jgi:M6 family metalloprotease-like protein
MKFQRSLPFVIVFALLLSACGGSAPTETIEPPTLAPPTETPAPTFTLAPTETAMPLPAFTPTSLPAVNPEVINQCKPSPVSFTNVGFGFPPADYKLPSLGDVKTIVLFADFADVPGKTTPEKFLSEFSPDAENFYSTVSYGRMNWILEPHLVWLRLSHDSAYYGEAIRSYEGHLEFIQEAVRLADADVDFSSADSVVVMVPPEATAVEFGPALGANPSEGYSADGRVFSNGVTSAADFSNWGFIWLNHESGHTMGLPDLYGYDWDGVNYDDIHRFVGGFSSMGFTAGDAFEYFAFERWQLGWLDDNQFVCQLDADQTTTLTAIETAGGLKAVIVPLGPNRILVVESRRALGYDEKISKEGALVYVVDTTIASGYGTLVVYPVLDGDPYRYKSPLAVGETVTVEGVTVTVVEATDQGDTVQVTVAK